MRVLLLIIIFLIPCSVWALDPLIGQKAPTLSGKQAVGRGLLKLSKMTRELGFLKDKQGKFVEKDGEYIMQVTRNVVVLNFFATYCVPCIKEIPSFNDLYQSYEGKGVKLVYVNVDPDMDQATAQKFIVQKGIEVPMMLPNQRQAVKSYGVVGLPRIVIIDRNGKISEVIIGFKTNLKKQLSKIIEGLLLKGNT